MRQTAFYAEQQAQEKQALRRICRAKLALLPPPSAQSGALLCAALQALPAYHRAHTVFCYISCGTEADTRTFLQAVLDDGKTVCAPWCERPGVMYARQLNALDALEAGAYGIPAPVSTAPLVPASTIDFAVLPCLAADKSGNRLGHGAGFYDRFLPNLPATTDTVVLCRAALLLPVGQIPLEPHDIPANSILTDES